VFHRQRDRARAAGGQRLQFAVGAGRELLVDGALKMRLRLIANLSFLHDNDYLCCRERRLCRRIKEYMNKTTMTGDRFIAAFLSSLAEEGLKHDQTADRRAEYRKGYPKASEAEIQMLFDAGEKAGFVPHNLDHARLILSDNVFAFPSATKEARHHWPVPNKNTYSSAVSLIIARGMKRYVAEHPDLAPALLADAIALEQRALDAATAGVSEITLPST
jgi:hypothetical protein